MQIRIDREELDEAIFAAAQDVMGAVTGWTTRQKLTVTLNMTNALMARVDLLVKDTTKSANATKAAKKRWAKNVIGDAANVPNPTPRRRRAPAADAIRTVPLAPPEGATMHDIPPADPAVAPAPFGSSERI